MTDEQIIAKLREYAENADFNAEPNRHADEAAFIGSEDGPMFRALADRLEQEWRLSKGGG